MHLKRLITGRVPCLSDKIDPSIIPAAAQRSREKGGIHFAFPKKGFAKVPRPLTI